jgi:hypothetical protein
MELDYIDFEKTQMGGDTYRHSQHELVLLRTQRRQAYDIAHQLNLLWDDIEAGVFGESAQSGQFAQYIRAIKQQFPKPNLDT